MFYLCRLEFVDYSVFFIDKTDDNLSVKLCSADGISSSFGVNESR